MLKVGAGGQSEGNNGPAITGVATWVPITDANGGPIAGVSTVLPDFTIDGRVSADDNDVLGTGYNRPEDMVLQTLARHAAPVFRGNPRGCGYRDKTRAKHERKALTHGCSSWDDEMTPVATGSAGSTVLPCRGSREGVAVLARLLGIPWHGARQDSGTDELGDQHARLTWRRGLRIGRRSGRGA